MTDDAENVQVLPKAGDIWRHYRGGEYQIVGMGRLEATDEPAVFYRATEGKDATTWARSLSDWQTVLPGHGSRFVFLRSVITPTGATP